MNSAGPKELATEILSDSDHSTKVAPTTLRGNFQPWTELGTLNRILKERSLYYSAVYTKSTVFYVCSV